MATYQESKTYVEGIEKILGDELKSLEESIIKGRDDVSLKIPISSTKWRLKSTGSAFLKMRRKNKRPEELFDYAGIRVLCLFEQDISNIHRYLLSVFETHHYILKEMTGFNWRGDKYHGFTETMESYIAASSYSGMKFNIEDKRSGYKSVHYVVLFERNGNNYPIEVQLRTIFQDAWGELEHALSYKQGNIHPHIKECFTILANDIESNDALMDHLKIIYNNEKFRELFSIEHAGPFKFLEYEDDAIPDIFASDPLREPYGRYVNFILDKIEEKKSSKEWVREAEILLATLSKAISYDVYDSDKKCQYFMDMEKAFLSFRGGDIEKALPLYEKCTTNYSNRYVPFFRIGEILFIREMIPEALAKFDETEELMRFFPRDYVNKYKILSKIAHVYWLLGPEYIMFSTTRILEAGKLIEHFVPETLQNKTTVTWQNNVSYYLLEQYLNEKNDDNYKQFLFSINQLTEFDTKENNFGANHYDTLAWGYYNIYLNTRKRDDLKKAKLYCGKMLERPNTATFIITSQNIQMNHFLEIMRS
ncbi:MAG: GTP pyrophosphokinase [Syntrophales bacterium]